MRVLSGLGGRMIAHRPATEAHLEVLDAARGDKGVLDGAWCGKLADAAKPSCQLVLGLPVDEDTLIRAKSVGVAGVVVAGENAELEQLCRASSWSYAVVQP